MSEKQTFQTLLSDLCSGIEEPKQEKGRPRASLRDMMFSKPFKVYSTVSTRRFQTEINEACEKGHIEKAPMQHDLQVSGDARSNFNPQANGGRIKPSG